MSISPGRAAVLAAWGLIVSSSTGLGQQPKVNPGPDEPDWVVLLATQWGLDMERDLRNPLREGVTPAALFQRVDADKPVTFTPIIALGMENPTHGGWYPAGPRAGDTHASEWPMHELWTYAHKQPVPEMQRLSFSPPPLTAGKTEFDPGDATFGLWVRNENFDDPGVTTQPGLVAETNPRLASQPYKAMIYPNFDKSISKFVNNSFIIGWEYSTNDDFQDVVTRIDNVRLLPEHPALQGILAPDAEMRKLASGFAFVEGPAWSHKDKALYFTNIPAAEIVRYADGQATVANDTSGRANGLMFDRPGGLIACEGAGDGGGRRMSRRASVGEVGETLAETFEGKRFNSPNDLWLDTEDGVYFTDPRYGPQSDRELPHEAVYYLAADGTVTCVIDDLVRPNGIAIAPDGRSLYVVDNGADTLWRYPVLAPGRLGKGQRLSRVQHPDGMTVDESGRLFITCDGGVWVLDDDGKWLGMILTPERPSNCTFGGTDNRTLFVTARTSLYAIDTLTRGWHAHLKGPSAIRRSR